MKDMISNEKFSPREIINFCLRGVDINTIRALRNQQTVLRLLRIEQEKYLNPKKQLFYLQNK